MRLCSMRASSSTWTSWKWTVLSSVAEWTFTGTKTPAKEIVPFQIERRAMCLRYPRMRTETRSFVQHHPKGVNAHHVLSDDPGNSRGLLIWQTRREAGTQSHR